jgi:pimeloyl-ACP methyl ester carboxylesterase
VSASTDKPYRSTPIRFSNGGVELAGTVLSPRESGRHPAVVFIHGSGAEGRWANGFLADYVARRGVVALIYDKRGVGESTGDWKMSTLEDLSRDAKAAVHLLAGRPDVDPQRVGLYGHSQGGFIAPIVAAANGEVRWIVDADGNVGPQYEQDLFRVESALAKRFDGQQLRDAMSLYREFVDVARGGLSRDQLHADEAKHRSAAWYDALGLPDDEDWIWEWYRGVGNADNRRAWAAIDVPVLLVYGERDEVVPPRRSIDAITSLIAANHDTAITVRVLSGADHSLRVPPADALGWPRYADGFPALIVDWIHGLRR